MTKSGYEKKDLSFRVVAMALGGLLLLVGFVYLTSNETLRLLSKNIPGVKNEVPQSPRLQADPARDLLRLHETEDAVLNHYGWLDRSRGIVHIPITRAMDLLLERGVPTREDSPSRRP